MSITVKSIYYDTENFFRNQFVTILVVALLCAFTTTVLSHIFLSNEIQTINFSDGNKLVSNVKLFEIFKNISLRQQKIILRTTVISSFSSLISNTILVGSILLMIELVSSGQQVNALKVIRASIPILPKLFILIFLTTLSIQIGIVLIILPGILSAIVLSIAPIILIRDKTDVFTAMYNSINLSWSNIHLVAPAVISWLLAKVLLLFFAQNFLFFTLNINLILTNTLNNLLSAILLIYLFRLCMLIHR